MNQIAEAKPRAVRPAEEFRGQLTSLGGEIANALPPHIPVERFMRVVMTAVNGNPDLLNCDRKTLFESAMKAAQDGLLPDGRDGALVKFGSSVQWMPMVGGILKKVRNSGELLSISAHVVYSADRFLYRLGDDETIEHEPAMVGDRGGPVAVYAIAKTKDGGIYREVMSVAEVEKVRNVSRAKNAGPWTQWWDEMARKTAIRRLSKRLPMSTDLDDLIRRDDELYDFSNEPRAPQPAGIMKRLGSKPSAEGFTANHVAEDARTVDAIPDRSAARGEEVDGDSYMPSPVGQTPASEPEIVEEPVRGLMPIRPRFLFEDYQLALIRFGDVEKLKKASDEFWSRAGGRPDTNTLDHGIAIDIFGVNKNRVSGAVSLDDCKKFVAELLDEKFGG